MKQFPRAHDSSSVHTFFMSLVSMSHFLLDIIDPLHPFLGFFSKDSTKISKPGFSQAWIF